MPDAAPDIAPEPEDEAAENVTVKPFGAWLQEQRGGVLHSELSEYLQEIAAAALEFGKVGKLVLTVKLEPNEDGSSLFIADEVKATVPEPDRPKSLFFADSAGNLSRRDPRQKEIPGLREAPAPASKPRDINDRED